MAAERGLLGSAPTLACGRGYGTTLLFFLYPNTLPYKFSTTINLWVPRKLGFQSLDDTIQLF